MKKDSKQSRTILVCGDIHGNLPALEAVFNDTRKDSFDEIWNLGDITGYVPFPVGVIELLQKRRVVNIIGNYDQKVLAFNDHQDQWKDKKRSDKYRAFEWNHKQLSGPVREFLESLPETVQFKINGFDITLVHAGEGVDGPGITPETPSDYLENMARIHKADVLLFGHSHVPMVKRIAGKVFINPGSVGIPDGDDLRASYAVVNIENNKIEADLRHIDYDVDRVIRAMHAAGRSKALISLFGTTTVKSLHRKVNSPESEKVLLKQVLALAEKCEYERGHTEQVTKLALSIFDGLEQLHGRAALWCPFCPSSHPISCSKAPHCN